jgi:hypothetical protein
LENVAPKIGTPRVRITYFTCYVICNVLQYNMYVM